MVTGQKLGQGWGGWKHELENNMGVRFRKKKKKGNNWSLFHCKSEAQAGPSLGKVCPKVPWRCCPSSVRKTNSLLVWRYFHTIGITQSINESGRLRPEGKTKIEVRTKPGASNFIRMLDQKAIFRSSSNLFHLSSYLFCLRTAEWLFLITQHSGFTSFLSFFFFSYRFF